MVHVVTAPSRPARTVAVDVEGLVVQVAEAPKALPGAETARPVAPADVPVELQVLRQLLKSHQRSSGQARRSSSPLCFCFSFHH